MEEGAIWALALSLVSRCEIGKCPEMSTVDKRPAQVNSLPCSVSHC